MAEMEEEREARKEGWRMMQLWSQGIGEELGYRWKVRLSERQHEQAKLWEGKDGSATDCLAARSSPDLPVDDDDDEEAMVGVPNSYPFVMLSSLRQFPLRESMTTIPKC